MIKFTPEELAQLVPATRSAAIAISDIVECLLAVAHRIERDWTGNEEAIRDIVDDFSTDLVKLTAEKIAERFGNPGCWERKEGETAAPWVPTIAIRVDSSVPLNHFHAQALALYICEKCGSGNTGKCLLWNICPDCCRERIKA